MTARKLTKRTNNTWTGLTEKQLKAARALVAGKSYREAAEIAGYPAKTGANAVGQLMLQPHFQKEVGALRAETRKLVAFELVDVFNSLWEIADDRNKPTSERLKAMAIILNAKSSNQIRIQDTDASNTVSVEITRKIVDVTAVDVAVIDVSNQT